MGDKIVTGHAVVVDGPALRSARDSQEVPLRRIARTAGMSHGHLSKVERGEHGRPVTPRILYAYEKCLGMKIAEAVAAGELAPEHQRQQGKDWRPGQMSEFQLRQFRAQVAAVGVGGSAGMPVKRLLEMAGRVDIPRPPCDEQVASLERLAQVLGGMGGLAGTVAHRLLGWATRLPTDGDTGPRVDAVVALLAGRAAAGALATGRHESARHLYVLALEAAAAADHPDLRALVLADIATQHAGLGYTGDALAVLRLAEGDERIGDDTRAKLKTVRAGAEGHELRAAQLVRYGDVPGRVA